MSDRLVFWVVGGDSRFPVLAQELAGDGHEVHTFGLAPPEDTALDGIRHAHCVILPIPAHTGELLNAPALSPPPPLKQVLDALAPGQLVCAGGSSPALEREAQKRQLRLINYLDREELAVANAVPTSEGAIALAMEHLPITLHGARVLVIGAGRLGRVLVRQLKGLGSAVTVAARRPADLAWAKVWGCAGVHTDRLAGALDAFELVINTVPSLILDRERLSRLRPGCLVIDLASAPGGTDFSAADALGVKAIHALALPGKAAPVTAALAIKTTLYHILELGA